MSNATDAPFESPVVFEFPRLDWHEDRLFGDPGPPRILARKVASEHPDLEAFVLLRKGRLCLMRYDATTWMRFYPHLGSTWFGIDLVSVGFGFTKRAAMRNMLDSYPPSCPRA